MNAEEFLINSLIMKGFTEDYIKMMFRLNKDSMSAYIETLIEFAQLHAIKGTKPADIQ